MIAGNFVGNFGVLSGGEKEKMEDEKQGNDRRQVCRVLWGEQMMGERKEWRMLIKVMVYLVQTGVFW